MTTGHRPSADTRFGWRTPVATRWNTGDRPLWPDKGTRLTFGEHTFSQRQIADEILRQRFDAAWEALKAALLAALRLRGEHQPHWTRPTLERSHALKPPRLPDVDALVHAPRPGPTVGTTPAALPSFA